MSDNSAIEWCDATWNPTTGCTKITTGCDRCYAARFAERFRNVPGHPYEAGFDLTLRPERLKQPLSWMRPRMIFVDSMSDLFHKDIPTAYIDKVFDTMEEAEWHRFQVITKRSSLMRDYARERYGTNTAPAYIALTVSVREALCAVSYLARRLGRGGNVEEPYRAPARDAGGCALSVDRADALAFGRSRLHRHSLAVARRRDGPRRTSLRHRLGSRNPRPVRGEVGRVLLQAMGRSAAKNQRDVAGRARVEGVSAHADRRESRRLNSSAALRFAPRTVVNEDTFMGLAPRRFRSPCHAPACSSPTTTARRHLGKASKSRLVHRAPFPLDAHPSLRAAESLPAARCRLPGRNRVAPLRT